MFSTSILESLHQRDRHSTGHTAKLKVRLSVHYRGKYPHMVKHVTWKIRCYFAFETEALARRFKNYLKSGSGRAFAMNGLW
jgi:hypothetical protein